MKQFVFGAVVGAVGAIGLLVAAILVFGDEEIEDPHYQQRGGW